MHFEFLVEDKSGKAALEIIVPKIIGNGHSFRIHAYKGIGRIPKNLNASPSLQSKLLLDNLPRLLRGYGKSFPIQRPLVCAIVVVCDLDRECLKNFRNQLLAILSSITQKPEARFCFAVEESEAWLLGDESAIKSGYPNYRCHPIRSYVQDSVCGTWEVLANAVHQGGHQALSNKGWQQIGFEKTKWATAIAPHMTISANKSPSFQYFCMKLHELLSLG